MPNLADVPIRTKLLITGALSSGIALLLAGLAIIAYDNYSYGQLKTRVLASQADTLALSTSAAIAFNDTKAATEYLKAFEANPEILAAAVYGPDGKIFASYQRSGAANPPPPATAESAGEHLACRTRARDGGRGDHQCVGSACAIV